MNYFNHELRKRWFQKIIYETGCTYCAACFISGEVNMSKTFKDFIYLGKRLSNLSQEYIPKQFESSDEILSIYGTEYGNGRNKSI